MLVFNIILNICVQLLEFTPIRLGPIPTVAEKDTAAAPQYYCDVSPQEQDHTHDLV